MGQKQFFPCQLLGLGLGVCTVKVVIEVAKVGDCLHFCFKKRYRLWDLRLETLRFKKAARRGFLKL